MRSLTRIAFAALTVASLARADGQGCPANPGNPNCPTVTTTASVCSTCVVKDCLALSTISNPADCPPKIATSTTSYPCESSTCPPGCASTSYIYASTLSSYSPPVTLTPTACPTVTTVVARCSTCVQPACMSLVTIRSQCGCAAAVPTVTVSYACDGTCPGGCMGTSYVYETATPSCEPTTPPTGTECVPTVTVTTHPGTSGGCDSDCPNSFCIIDKFVTLPCGCTSAKSVETVTESSCATKECNCHTGFPFTTTATDCAPTPY